MTDGTTLKRFCRRAMLVLALTCTLSAKGYAQESGNPPAATPDQQGTERKVPDPSTTPDQSTDAQPAAVLTPAYPVSTQIRPAGRTTPWLDSRNPLHLGPISLASLDFVSVYDQFYPSVGGASDIERLNLLRANVVFDKMFAKNRIFLQFTPVLANLNGHTHGNTGLDNTVTLGTALALTPRLNLTLRNELGITKTRQLFPNDLLLVDQQNGGVVQGYFLEFNGTHVQDSFTTVFDYKLAPRWLLTIAPGYTYSDTYNPTEEFRISDSVNTVSVTYQLSPRINVGALETVEFLHPIAPVASNGLFETSSLFYSEQIAPTLWFTARVGGESAKYPGFGGTTWATSGSASLVKVFSRGQIAGAYYRGSTLTNFITNRQTDHADLSYTYRIFPQFAWTGGIGYFRTTGAEPRDSGKYGLTTLQYMLRGGLSLYGTYTRRNQRSTNQLLISGDRNTFAVGLRWEPGAAALH